MFKAIAARGLSTVLLAAAFIIPQQAAAKDGAAAHATPPAPFTSTPFMRADFGRERASPDARHVADWVVHSGDNHTGEVPADSPRLPFVILDKKEAKVFVFHPDGRLRGAAPALLGIAKGDDSAPGIGDRDLKDIPVKDRTTPAGRFVAKMGFDSRGVDVLIVNYEHNIAMHRVINSNPKERRPHRLATPTPLDNRISFGCINLPVKFYENVLVPAFTGTNGIVYVLPETRPARKVFASYDLGELPPLKPAIHEAEKNPADAPPLVRTIIQIEK